MSDIAINISWWELLLFSPVIGWPGIAPGALAGWFAWRKRPVVGAAIGAVLGNLLWFAVVLFGK